MIHNKKNIGIQMLESPFLIATYFVEEVQSKTDTISPKYMQKSEDSWRLTASPLRFDIEKFSTEHGHS